eukprot:1692944-Pleurochrysis_carterae.AAC.1
MAGAAPVAFGRGRPDRAWRCYPNAHRSQAPPQGRAPHHSRSARHARAEASTCALARSRATRDGRQHEQGNR